MVIQYTRNMHQKELELIGLSPNEAKIYETLLRLGETNVTEITNKSGIHRRNVYDTLTRLIEKGLVFQVFQKKENLYQAVDPRKCLELLKEREKAFTKILPGLEYFQKHETQDEAAFIYRGLEGYKNYVRDLIRTCDDTYFLGAKFNWGTPGTESLLKQYNDAMKRAKKKQQTLFDPRVKELIPKKDYEKVRAYKFLPEKYETPGVMDVFGEYVVTFRSMDIGSFGEDGTIFVLKNQDLADSYRVWFRFIWDHC